MQASVRRFWLLRKTINRGNGTESLLRCCSAARILHSERPAFACDCRSYGWVAQLAEQWTENPRVGGSIPPPAISYKIVPWNGLSVEIVSVSCINRSSRK